MSEEWRNEETKILDFYGMVKLLSETEMKRTEIETERRVELWAIQTINLDFFPTSTSFYRPSIVYEICLISLLSLAVITSRLHYIQIIFQSKSGKP